MGWFEALIYGIVQGFTEFLPISSTAHLILLQMAFGYTLPGLSFELMLHFASCLAIIFYFRKELIQLVSGGVRYLLLSQRQDKSSFIYLLYLFAATLVTAVVGFSVKPYVETSMKTPEFIGGALLVTAIALWVIERFAAGTRTIETMNMKDAICVGFAQALAVIPGISRSGATLLAGLSLGIDRETAVKFSFLLAIPIMLGTSVLAFDELQGLSWYHFFEVSLLAAMIMAFFCSLICIHWLLYWIRSFRLTIFSVYCFILALIVLFGFSGQEVIDVYLRYE
ncbi:undecaprenyl-diphosphate phosphatase [Salsuginibacillus kocurii]|uniref:undecaprenyl-diphosphate phosphatase n=1 Tax=Salsuginibacillus kocurii TaxID=427078 RepID=UPI000362D3CB|nr:undecaprenyl-diphosphate phosphatase [Salsuginibacillus kocurii]